MSVWLSQVLNGGLRLPDTTLLPEPGIELPDESSGAAVYSVTGSGGLSLSGSGTITRTLAILATGGLLLAGAASLKTTKAVAGAGGLTIAGAGTSVTVRPHLATGGLTFGGTSQVKRTHARTGTGGVTLAGAALQARTFKPAASGGATFSGAATTSYIPAGAAFSYTGSGGLSLAGAAATPRTFNRTGSGGVTYAGAAGVLRTYAGAGAGGLSFGGTGSVKRTNAAMASGGLVFAGAAGLARTRTAAATGGLTFGGTATAGRVFQAFGTGGITLAGVATARRTYAASGTGGLFFAGAAVVSRTTATAGSGGVTFSGAATSTLVPAFLVYSVTGTGGVVLGGAAITTAPVQRGGGGHSRPAYTRMVWRRPAALVPPKTRTYLASGGVTFGGQAICRLVAAPVPVTRPVVTVPVAPTVEAVVPAAALPPGSAPLTDLPARAHVHQQPHQAQPWTLPVVPVRLNTFTVEATSLPRSARTVEAAARLVPSRAEERLLVLRTIPKSKAEAAAVPSQHGPAPALAWPEPERIIEAGPDGPNRQIQRANRAGAEVAGEYSKLEDEAARQLLRRLATLQQSLRQRLTQQLTDFKRYSVTTMLADVDRMIADVQAAIQRDQERNFTKATQLGVDAVLQPVRALRVQIPASLPGLDTGIVQATFGNAVDLLSVPMQQFAGEVKASLRRATLAADNKFEEIQRLQRVIAGAGFDNAQYRAERIMRTEMGRSYNLSTYEKMLAMAGTFPFLKKAWRATPGDRTRIGHREAGERYKKGQGIPIAQLFQINVYDERDKKAPKKLGVAQLRFPIDPQAKPEGRLAAGATIQCRCNAFVDVDVNGYASHVKNRVQNMNLGQPPAAALPPASTPPAAGVRPGGSWPDPKETTFYRGRFGFTQQTAAQWAGQIPGATVVQVGGRLGFVVQNAQGLVMGTKGWVPLKPAPKVRVQVPAPAPGVTVDAAPAVTNLAATPTPAGRAVSAAAKVVAGKANDVIRRALALLDQVHGDGDLPDLPLQTVGRLPHLGEYSRIHGRGAIAISVRTNGPHPLLTTFHEVGHWLDHVAIAKGGATGSNSGAIGAWRKRPKAKPIQAVVPNVAPARVAGATAVGQYASVQAQTTDGADSQTAAVARLMDAIGASRSVQILNKWDRGGAASLTDADGLPGMSRYADREHVRYLLRPQEQFARAYAQYIAVRSGDRKALVELAVEQNAMKKMGNDPLGGAYPYQWDEDDFRPIAEAFDALMEAMKWRTRKK